jgi:hypothetical protein
LAEDILNYAINRRFRIFGVVCFGAQSALICDDEVRLELPFRYLFERIDLYMKQTFPRRFAKLVFDDRGHSTNARNGRAATNFFVRSRLGMSYDTIIKTPFYGVSKANNYGLQLADLVTTVIGLRFQGKREFDPLFEKAQRLLHVTRVGEIEQSSLKVMRTKTEMDSAACEPMAGEIAQHRVLPTGTIIAPSGFGVNSQPPETWAIPSIVPNNDSIDP